MEALSKTKMLLAIAVVCGLGIFAGCGSKEQSGESQKKKPIYTSEALLEVSPPSFTVFSTVPFTNKDVLESHKMSTLQMIFEEQVLNTASQDKDLRGTAWYKYKARPSDETIDRLKKEVKVSAVPRTMFIKVSMTGTRREDLPVVVNAVCDAFVARMKQQADQQTAKEMDHLEKERPRLAENLNVVIKKKSELIGEGADSENPSQELESLQTEQGLIEDKIGRIERRLLELELLRDEEPVKLRSRAVSASQKTDPR